MATIFQVDSAGNITDATWQGTVITPVYGGTGLSSLTAYGVLCGGTTSTGNLQSVSGLGTSGQVLTSNGAAALPTWQAVTTGTVTSVSGTTNQIDVATGTTTPVISIDAAYVGQTSITTLGTITTGTWNGTTVTVSHGGTGNTTFTAYSVLCAGTTATGVFQNVSGLGTSGQVLTSAGAGALPTWTSVSGTGTVTNVSGTANQIDVATGTSTPVISIDAAYVGQSSITTLGTITSGTWHGTVIGATYGGTGVNNGSSTITLGGSLTLSGAFSTTLTVTGGTNVTLPTSGTLVNTAVTTLSSLTSIGTIGTGVWNGTDITVPYGGTGLNSTTAYGVICGGTTTTAALQNAGAGTSGQVLVSNGASALPTWQALSGSGTVTSVASSLGITGGTITSTGTLGLDLTVVTEREVCKAATTTNLTATYSNGSSGVGATLTNNGTQATLTIDFVTLSVGNRVLIKNQTIPLQNGIYTVTNLGSNSTNWVLTRATDFDGSITGCISQGVNVSISRTLDSIQTVNSTSKWFVDIAGTYIVGSSAITFVGYLGQNTINKVGTIINGLWKSTDDPIGLAYGGTGIDFTGENQGLMVFSGSSMGTITTPLTPFSSGSVFGLIDTGPNWLSWVSTIARNNSFVSSTASGTTIFPINNSTPQNTYGDQFMSLTVTTATGNGVKKFLIDVLAYVSNNSGSNIAMSLFQSGNSNAIASAICNNVSQVNYIVPIQLKALITAPAGTNTFTVRIGSPNSGSITSFNESGFTPYFNNTMSSYIIVSQLTS